MTKSKAILKKILKWVSTVLTVLILAVCALLLYTKYTQALPYFGKYAFVYVKTESMEPTIPRNSFIIVEKIKAENVNIGDTIIFRSDDPSIEGQFNTHSVIDIVGDHEEFVTKGINNPTADLYTAKAGNIKGRYVKNAAFFNTFAKWFKTRWGLVITLLVIILICCAVYVPDIIRASKEEKRALIEKERERIIKEEIEKLEKSKDKEE